MNKLNLLEKFVSNRERLKFWDILTTTTTDLDSHQHSQHEIEKSNQGENAAPPKASNPENHQEYFTAVL